jgi:hypothetical protein
MHFELTATILTCTSPRLDQVLIHHLVTMPTLQRKGAHCHFQTPPNAPCHCRPITKDRTQPNHHIAPVTSYPGQDIPQFRFLRSVSNTHTVNSLPLKMPYYLGSIRQLVT